MKLGWVGFHRPTRYAHVQRQQRGVAPRAIKGVDQSLINQRESRITVFIKYQSINGSR